MGFTLHLFRKIELVLWCPSAGLNRAAHVSFLGFKQTQKLSLNLNQGCWVFPSCSHTQTNPPNPCPIHFRLVQDTTHWVQTTSRDPEQNSPKQPSGSRAICPLEGGNPCCDGGQAQGILHIAALMNRVTFPEWHPFPFPVLHLFTSWVFTAHEIFFPLTILDPSLKYILTHPCILIYISIHYKNIQLPPRNAVPTQAHELKPAAMQPLNTSPLQNQLPLTFFVPLCTHCFMRRIKRQKAEQGSGRWAVPWEY